MIAEPNMALRSAIINLPAKRGWPVKVEPGIARGQCELLRSRSDLVCVVKGKGAPTTNMG
jgi:hypothetical protein